MRALPGQNHHARISEREQLFKRPLRFLIGRIHVHCFTTERFRSQQELLRFFRLSIVGGERGFSCREPSEGADFTRIGNESCGGLHVEHSKESCLRSEKGEISILDLEAGGGEITRCAETHRSRKHRCNFSQFAKEEVLL